MSIELGDRVKDRVSGVTGVVVATVSYLYNSDSIGVRPEEIRDGKPAEAFFIDKFYLEVIQKGVLKKKSNPVCPFKRGDEVEDTISHYKGIIIGITYWISGCVRIAIQPCSVNKNKEPHEEQWFSTDQLKLIKKAKSKKEPGDGGPMATPTYTRSPKSNSIL